MIKKILKIFVMAVLSVCVFITAAVNIAFFGDKTTVKFINTVYFLNKSSDMESVYDDSIPKGCLITAKKNDNYMTNKIIIYRALDGEYSIGRISKINRNTEIYNKMTYVITAAVSQQFSEEIEREDIIAQCSYYQTGAYKVIMFLKSGGGLAGGFILPGGILSIMIMIFWAKRLGRYGKYIPLKNKKTVKKTSPVKELRQISKKQRTEDIADVAERLLRDISSSSEKNEDARIYTDTTPTYTDVFRKK